MKNIMHGGETPGYTPPGRVFILCALDAELKEHSKRLTINTRFESRTLEVQGFKREGDVDQGRVYSREGERDNGGIYSHRFVRGVLGG